MNFKIKAYTCHFKLQVENIFKEDNNEARDLF